MEIKRIAVLGAGQMGNGIAHVFSMSGFEVRLVDLDKALLDKSLTVIGKNIRRSFQ